MIKYIILVIIICINFSCYNEKKTKTYSKCAYHMNDFIEKLNTNKLHKLKRINEVYQYEDTLSKGAVFTYEFNNDSILTKFLYTKDNKEYYLEEYDNLGNSILKKGNPIDVIMYSDNGEYFLYVNTFTINNEYINFNLYNIDTIVLNFNKNQNCPNINYTKIYVANMKDENVTNYKIKFDYDIVCHCDSTIQSFSDSLSFSNK